MGTAPEQHMGGDAMPGDAPSHDDLARRVEELTNRLESLERARVRSDEPMSRRRMLRTAAATSVGAVAGVALAGMPAAHAAAGGPLVMGAANDAGSSGTSLTATANASVLTVSQTGATGNGVR